MDTTHQVVARIFRQESGRILASLIGLVRDFELAQDLLQDALIVALERWPEDGVPRNPGAWITTTARRKAIDRLRRENLLAQKQTLLQDLLDYEEQRGASAMDVSPIPDERLKLIFTCCHPALALEAQVALTLQTLGGLSTQEIARAFLIPLSTMAQRLVRAKRKIKEAGIPYRVPSLEVLEERVDAVLCVLYLIFNEGYQGTSGGELIKHELCDESIHLARVLTALLRREELLIVLPEALGLLALLLLHDSRRGARVGLNGELILLEEQDRSLWDQAKKQEGLALVEQALCMKRSGPYQLQAAISAVHIQAERAEETDWPQIAALYRILMQMTPSPVIELNRIVAVAMADGPLLGLELLARPEIEKALANYLPFYLARADFLRRSNQFQEAAKVYQHALTLCQNEREGTFVKRRIAEVTQA